MITEEEWARLEMQLAGRLSCYVKNGELIPEARCPVIENGPKVCLPLVVQALMGYLAHITDGKRDRSVYRLAEYFLSVDEEEVPPCI